MPSRIWIHIWIPNMDSDPSSGSRSTTLVFGWQLHTGDPNWTSETCRLFCTGCILIQCIKIAEGLLHWRAVFWKKPIIYQCSEYSGLQYAGIEKCIGAGRVGGLHHVGGQRTCHWKVTDYVSVQEVKWITRCWYWKVTDYVSVQGVLRVYIMLVDKGHVIEK